LTIHYSLDFLEPGTEHPNPLHRLVAFAEERADDRGSRIGGFASFHLSAPTANPGSAFLSWLNRKLQGLSFPSYLRKNGYMWDGIVDYARITGVG
jgi:hypothetical protein